MQWIYLSQYYKWITMYYKNKTNKCHVYVITLYNKQ
jgi:hypothetical protein